MTWTYSGDPNSSPKDEVRFLIGDTDSENPKVSDEEIEYALSRNNGDVNLAAADCARALAAKYASWATKSVGDLSLSYGDLMQHYLDLAASLETSASKKMRPQVFAGGISRTDKRKTELNSDRVRPSARVDQFRNRQH